MVTRVSVAPEMLTWAVQRAAWTEEKLAQRFPKFTAWIAGDAQPTLKELEKFAAATHAPFGMLFLANPPLEPLPLPDMRTMGNAELGRPSVDLLDTIYLCQSRQDWFRQFALAQGGQVVDFLGSATTSSPVLEVAQQIRQRLAFEVTERASFTNWEDALRQLIDRIEAIGVMVMVSGIVGADTHRKLRPEEFRGFAIADDLAPLIFVNGADSKAAQIFTLVHELAHIWLGESAVSSASMTSRSGVEAELWCNSIAAEVLLPLAVLRVDYLGQPDEEELVRLSRRYRVSTLVVLKRLFDAGFLDWDDYQRRYVRERDRVLAFLAAGRSSSGGNFYFVQPLRLSRRFVRAVVESTREGGTSYREAFHLLGAKKRETFENLALEAGAA